MSNQADFTFTEWCESCKLSKDTIQKLTTESITSTEILSTLAEQDVLALGLPIGQRSVLRKLVQGVKAFGDEKPDIRKHSDQQKNEQLNESLAIDSQGIVNLQTQSQGATRNDSITEGSKKCAFSGVRTSVLLGSAESQIITYDELYANKGKDFDIDTGIFTCQVPGIYYFSFTMRSYDNYHIGVTLVKNSSPQVSMITDASDRKVMQSQSVMLDLLIGDRVWLQLGPHKYFAVYSDDKKYITFNGFVLYPNYI
ncbi:complement C1q tumor necrosis factor-related protein 4-like isoform X2 [Saccoglossus kowalevskii]|uniref:Complement C1q tumor necrosis factor-related protein 4-like isoform X2 n=1 Tax=Saccoglossus kowalevskii TaxID=10224 RepID=A0ABM0LZR1_SACKO|nr:PREDICTED: complement C1q tumor necrosis factor-related protein 4-like isoform X2 [Saccoglossus kowalevskii]